MDGVKPCCLLSVGSDHGDLICVVAGQVGVDENEDVRNGF